MAPVHGGAQDPGATRQTDPKAAAAHARRPARRPGARLAPAAAAAARRGQDHSPAARRRASQPLEVGRRAHVAGDRKVVAHRRALLPELGALDRLGEAGVGQHVPVDQHAPAVGPERQPVDRAGGGGVGRAIARRGDHVGGEAVVSQHRAVVVGALDEALGCRIVLAQRPVAQLPAGHGRGAGPGVGEGGCPEACDHDVAVGLAQVRRQVGVVNIGQKAAAAAAVSQVELALELKERVGDVGVGEAVGHRLEQVGELAPHRGVAIEHRLALRAEAVEARHALVYAGDPGTPEVGARRGRGGAPVGGLEGQGGSADIAELVASLVRDVDAVDEGAGIVGQPVLTRAGVERVGGALAGDRAEVDVGRVVAVGARAVGADREGVQRAGVGCELDVGQGVERALEHVVDVVGGVAHVGVLAVDADACAGGRLVGAGEVFGRVVGERDVDRVGVKLGQPQLAGDVHPAGRVGAGRFRARRAQDRAGGGRRDRQRPCDSVPARTCAHGHPDCDKAPARRRRHARVGARRPGQGPSARPGPRGGRRR